ncbi:MAG: ABC transporter permease [Bacteroidota bacterium]
MLRHNLKTIFRQLWRSPLFTGIHFVGLTIGLCAVLIIFLFIRQERSYDRHYAAAEDIYRVVQITETPNEVDYSAGNPYPMPIALREEVSDFAAVAGLHAEGSAVVRRPGVDHQQLEEVFYADEGFLEVFNYETSPKVAASILAEPGKALIAQSTAQQLFGEDNPIGKTLEVDNDRQVTIEAVYPDQIRGNIQPELLVSLSTLPEQLHGFDRTSWGVSIGGVTYVRLSPGQNPAQYERSLAAFVDKYMNGEEEGFSNQLELQPATSIHFDTRFDSYTSVATISSRYLWVAGAIALLILLMACFNFINLSLAQNLNKSQMIGMRKVLGASGKQLWLQNWGEAFLIAIIAGIASVTILQWALPQVETLLQRDIYFVGLADITVWLFVLLSLLFVSLVAGGYPAWVIARKRPTEVLGSSKVVSNRGQGRLRQGMVLAQFVITLVMICSALTVSQQLDFLKNKDLGFRQDAILQVAQSEPGLDAQLREEWDRHAGIEGVSFSIGAPTSGNRLGTSYYPKGQDPRNGTQSVGIKPVDENYAQAYDLKMLAGRFFSATDAQLMEERITESGAQWPVVINETLARKLGHENPELALNDKIIISVNDAEGEVVGVVKDFHTHSLHEAVEPLVMVPISGLYYEIGVKVNPGQISEVLTFLEQSWKGHYPDRYFNYEFLDEALAEQYLSEDRTSTLLQGFAGLAIFIACLGLFGLTAIMVQQRRKEIGLRKVLGASVAQLWALLSKDMIRLIGLAILIAAPLTWWAMSRWLADFAYSVDMTPATFIVGGTALLLIALVTVSGQAIRAALANPIEALRNE